MLGSVDTVITVGAPQSNHARTVAAAARLVGWECHLMLGGDRPPRPSGNLVLDVALGAELHFAGADDWSVLEAASIRLASELTAQGRHVLTIPIGGSTPSGALGFVAAYLELLDQIEQFGITDATIVHATSTGETQAGLDYAHRVLGSGPDVIGVGVAKTQSDLTEDIRKLEAELVGLLGLDPGAAEPTVLEGYLGAGYAHPTDGAQAALQQLAKTEAILTDPVYSAKALHAVSDRARTSRGPLIFWHTGGVPALFSDSAGITRWP
jgi:1-aminocyclopropane-1-carboxylate deaminase/D-cysteine desulfhydrase-like pyridoxal-dependent ACC family enzyme